MGLARRYKAPRVRNLRPAQERVVRPSLRMAAFDEKRKARTATRLTGAYSSEVLDGNTPAGEGGGRHPIQRGRSSPRFRGTASLPQRTRSSTYAS